MGRPFGSGPGQEAGAAKEWVQERRAVRAERLCDATLACPHCDAPVGIAPGAHPLTAALVCPFCDHSAPARDFLSLEPPTRPTRVVVRVSLPAGSRG